LKNVAFVPGLFLMGIDPKLDSYSIAVDIRSDEPAKQYLVLGDLDHPSSMKFGWGQISDRVKQGLIKWSKPNKMPIEE
jgi:hypothetical protein